MTTEAIVWTVIGWVILFFVKKIIFKFILSLFQLVIRPIDYITNKANSFITPLEEWGFSRVLLNVILVALAIGMVKMEYEQLKISMNNYFAEQTAGNIAVSDLSAFAYIAITLVLGIFSLELIGFRHLIMDILSIKSRSQIVESWRRFISELIKPIGILKFFFGLVFLFALFYFAALQGDMGVDRANFVAQAGMTQNTDIVIGQDSTIIGPDSTATETVVEDTPNTIVSEVKDKLLYGLGFATPIVAAITFMSLEILIVTLFRLILLALGLTQKGLAIGYVTIKRGIDAITSPLTAIADKINTGTKGKTEPYLSPIDSDSVSEKLDEIEILIHQNNGNTKVEDIASHIADRIDDKMQDALDDTIDDLF